LNSLMSKVKDVISENENLSEHARFDADDAYKPYLSKTTKFTATSGPNILFESRISELEAQLTQANIDHRKILEENAELKRKRALGGDSFIDSSCAEAYKKQIENLQRDKGALEEAVKKLQRQVTELKELDVQVFSKSQRNRDLADHANFERAQADIEIRRLKVCHTMKNTHLDLINCLSLTVVIMTKTCFSLIRKYSFSLSFVVHSFNGIRSH
jgi:serologically defined colon cancer antigen 8